MLYSLYSELTFNSLLNTRYFRYISIRYYAIQCKYYCQSFKHTRIFRFQRDISTVIFTIKFNLTANENTKIEIYYFISIFKVYSGCRTNNISLILT